MLGLYRVLDLTDEKGFLCGRILGDLAADVIKTEPPGGDPSRNKGPFYHDTLAQKSLFWFAFKGLMGSTLTCDNLSKISSTLFLSILSFINFLENLLFACASAEKLRPPNSSPICLLVILVHLFIK